MGTVSAILSLNYTVPRVVMSEPVTLFIPNIFPLWLWIQARYKVLDNIESHYLFHIDRHNSIANALELRHSYTPVTPAKPTRNRPQTDKNQQIRGEIDLQSVLIRFCRFGVGLCTGRNICRGEIFQICLKDLSVTNCQLSVGYMSVWCRFCRGAFGYMSVLIWPPMVDGLSVIDWLGIGHMSADLTAIQGQFKTESSPTQHPIAYSRPTHSPIKTDGCRTYLEPKPNVNW